MFQAFFSFFQEYTISYSICHQARFLLFSPELKVHKKERQNVYWQLFYHVFRWNTSWLNLKLKHFHTEPGVVKFQPEAVKFEPDVVQFEPDVVQFEPEVVKFKPDIDKYGPDIVKYAPNNVKLKPEVVKHNVVKHCVITWRCQVDTLRYQVHTWQRQIHTWQLQANLATSGSV